jgi:hypothetical protein
MLNDPENPAQNSHSPYISSLTKNKDIRLQLQEDSMKKIANHLKPESKLATPVHTQKNKLPCNP